MFSSCCERLQPMSAHVSVIPCFILTGAVKVVPPVKSYTSSGVELEDGSLLEVDMILLATGYKSNYDFIDVPCIKGAQVCAGLKHVHVHDRWHVNISDWYTDGRYYQTLPDSKVYGAYMGPT